jgi:hypothetical protein
MASILVVHMRGCPYCVEVTGEGSMLKRVQDLVSVYEIERTDPLARWLDVKSFPTIFLNVPVENGGKSITFKFSGTRTPDALRSFVLEKLGQVRTLQKVMQERQKEDSHQRKR